MATTLTNIDETLIQEAGSTTGAEGTGSAAGAYPSDEEILGIGDTATGTLAATHKLDGDASLNPEKKANPATAERAEVTDKTKSGGNAEGAERAGGTTTPEEFEAIFAAEGTGPKLREIFEREAEYRELFPTLSDARELRQAFATNEDARAAVESQRELARVDELFESGDPAAHVELMTGLAQRDPAAFRSLAATFGERLEEIDPQAHRVIAGEFARAMLEAGRVPQQIELLARAAEKNDSGAVKFLAGELAARMEALRKGGAGAMASGGLNTKLRPPARVTASSTQIPRSAAPDTPTEAAAGKFVEGVNAEVEKSVEQAVGGRVAELLPDAPEGTRKKISGEIVREMDAALKKDTGLLQQVSAIFTAAKNSGQFGEQQRAAMAVLVLGRARAVLPAVAKRVVGEWTSAVMSSSQARRARQGAVASRAEVGVGGAPRPVSTQAARVDYTKMSDEEILNAE